jgi:retinol-binding protein 3
MRLPVTLRDLRSGLSNKQEIAGRLQSAVILSLLLLLLGIGRGFGQTTIPDTPAGKTLQAWLDAFNSGDRAKIESYVKTYDPKDSVERMMVFRSQSGGFDLIAIESSEPLLITFRVKEKNSPRVGKGGMQVTNAEPHTIEKFVLKANPLEGVVIENIKLDAAARQRVIDGVASNLKEFYVYPEAAQKMEDDIRARQKRGDYDAITDPDAFASKLNDNLEEVSHDKHLWVMYSSIKAPAERHAPSADKRAEFRKELERYNCGFNKVEILPGNVGYLEFGMFADAEICGPTAASAMNFLAHADAIIFDLRDNRGGDPKMVAFLSSYLFDRPTHLNDLYNRKEDSSTQYWTLPYVPGNRMPDKRVFVLTSYRTFSGAEEFAYNLKNLKRATIVGGTTGGGAHPVEARSIDAHFIIGVPFARAINPISKTDWEGTGVEPDVSVNESEALETAEKLAAKPPAKWTEFISPAPKAVQE